MKNNQRWIIIVLLILAALALVACGGTAAATSEQPAQIEAIEGSKFDRLILTERAAERLGIETAQVTDGQDGLVVPYSSVIYGTQGETWVYTNPSPLTYVRHVITVDHIEGGDAFVTEGPEVGAAVVTVGVAELYGEETGIKKTKKK
jgi:hypothetical protein